MNLRMADNSLFAILLRKPWWVSALVAAALIAFARFGLPAAWFLYGASISAPFIVIAAIAGWRQLQRPSASRVAAIDDAMRAMGWPELAAAVEDAWRADGWTVTRIDDRAADFEVVKGWRRGLVACKRWKSARTGIEPLRELHAARERREVHECTYVALGEVSEQALKYAASNRIVIARAAELAALMPKVGRGARGGLKRSPG